MRSQKPIIGISGGDPSGIGPEIIARALKSSRLRDALVPVIFADASLAASVSASLQRVDGPLTKRPQRPTLVRVSQLPAAKRQPGKPSLAGARAQFEYVDAAILAAQHGLVDGLCTAPVSKAQISRVHPGFSGHTGMLAERFGVSTLMLMDGPRLKVALATEHVPLVQVAQHLSVPRLVAQLSLLSNTLKTTLRRRPRIAMCGLNPHAGDGGVIGQEEQRLLTPAIRRAQRQGIDCEGPFPADGLFASHAKGFDAVLALYHDQGLIPVKALDFERTVNVTLGLPVPRTSPDHGVAYGIAGTGKANAVPMRSALMKVIELARARAAGFSRAPESTE